MNKAIFLDRDGVLNAMVNRDGKQTGPWSLEEFELLPGVCEAVMSLRDAGFLCIVVTNQPDAARGHVDLATLKAINRTLLYHWIPDLNGVMACYSTNDADPMRKPNPGMLLKAAENWDIDLSHSWMIGDRIKDMWAGKSAGCFAMLIHSFDAVLSQPLLDACDVWAESLPEAADYIIFEETLFKGTQCP